MQKRAGISKFIVLAVAALTCSLALVGCSNDSAASNKERPEGSWTLVRWLETRSDTDAVKGLGQLRQWKLDPTCDAGKCDIDFAPDGVNGTSLPEGYLPSDPAQPQNTGGKYTYNAGNDSYDFTSATKTSCTNADGKVVQDAYEVTTTTSLKFTPVAEGKNAALHGTYKQTSKGVGAGIEAKCTDFEATYSVAGAPTGKFNKSADISGEYVVTEIVEATQPAETRAPGFTGILLPNSKIEKVGDKFKVGGVGANPAEVSAKDKGFEGNVTNEQTCKASSGDVPNGLSDNEEWTELRAVTATDDGKLILAGRWNYKSVPTDAGKAANCVDSSNKGYVIFVPKSAV